MGLHLLNGSEYLEGMLATYKLRAVPVNVNYRYVEDELEYLYRDAGLVALIHHRQFAPSVTAVAPHRVPAPHPEPWTTAIPPTRPGFGGLRRRADRGGRCRDFGPRSSDDLYIAYTGGTTGMPKGVLWRHEDIFFGAMGGGDLYQAGDPIGALRGAAGASAEEGGGLADDSAVHARERALDGIHELLRRGNGRDPTARSLRPARCLATDHRGGRERPHDRR